MMNLLMLQMLDVTIELVHSGVQYADFGISAIVMAAIAAATAIAGGVASGVQGAKSKKTLAEGQAKTDGMYDELYYQDILKRKDTQNLINSFERNQRAADAKTRAANLISGATPEVGIAARQASADARANMISDITANAAKEKNQYKVDKAKGDQQYATTLSDQQSKSAQGYATMAANAATTAMAGAAGMEGKFTGKW